jgi:hypothetical protein
LRLGLALLAMVGGAVLGWALSLTQGSHVQHWPWIAVGAVLALAVALITVGIIARRRRSTSEDQTPIEPMHPVGVTVRAGKKIDIGRSGAILTSGPGALIDLTSDGSVTNRGLIHASHDGPGVRLVDHLRLIAGHINDHASKWVQRPAEPSRNSNFAAEYIRFGYGCQAAELYDSAIRAGLKTDHDRAWFNEAASPEDARQVSLQLTRWAVELNKRSIRVPRQRWGTPSRR